MLKSIIRLGALALVLAPATGHANDWMTRLDIGGRAGLNMARFAGPGANDQSVSSQYEPGFHLGGILKFQITHWLAAQTELTFALKRPHTTMGGADFGTYRMSYLEVPLLIHGTLPVASKVACHGVTGPALGVLFDAGVSLADGQYVDIDNGFSRVDLGWVLGAGAAVTVRERDAVLFDLRSNIGLMNIDENAAPEDDDVTNVAFYFTVGYRTNLDTLLGGSSGASPSPR